MFTRESDGRAAYPPVSGGDVLQRSGCGLAGGGVGLALVQHPFVQAQNLRVPQPLHAPGHPRHLGEGGQVLVLTLSGERSETVRRTVWTAGAIMPML